MKYDLFEFFILVNGNGNLFISATCRHCRVTVEFPTHRPLIVISEQLDSHQCFATPLSQPVNREIVP